MEPMPRPVVIAPEGELDIANVEHLRRSLAEAAQNGTDGLVVDLSGVEFIDSSGLGAIIETYERFRREHRSLAVVAPRGSAAALILTLTGLRRKVPVYESRQAALDA